MAAKVLEVTDHLKNVQVTTADVRATDVASTSPLLPAAHAIGFSNYQAYGALQPSRSLSTLNYRYAYQGSEQNPEPYGAAATHYTTYFRQLDARLARWWSTDPVVDAWQGPFSSMDNNPIRFNDPRGDDIDVSDMTEETKKSILNDWIKISGLKLSINNEGLFEYERQGNRPVVLKTEKGKRVGSRYARRLIKKAIDQEDVIRFINIETADEEFPDVVEYDIDDMFGQYPMANTGNIAGTNAILLLPSQVESNISGMSASTNPLTFGYGMVALHEMLHTVSLGDYDDPSERKARWNSRGQVVNRINIVRRQLGLAQRYTYSELYVKEDPDSFYIPFDKASYQSVRDHKVPPKGSKYFKTF